MLKIGTSKMGSVVECPRCHKSIVVPPQSAPQAEELYRRLKTKRAEETAVIPPHTGEIHAVSEPTVPESAWDELGGNVDDADLNQWIDELWTNAPENRSEPISISPPNFEPASIKPVADMLTVLALQKRHRLTKTLLYVSATIAFFIGIIFGFFLHGNSFQPMSFDQRAEESGHKISGTLYYLNENGERRADVDAAIICFPDDCFPSPLFSCQGLRPDDKENSDTIQLIHELGGMYERADTNGSFTLSYREGVRYLIIFISAHQMRTDGIVKPSVLQDLRRYFRDPELFGNYCINVDEYDLSRHSFRHTFE